MPVNKKHHLIRPTCKFCGRRLRFANLPNRGATMVHAAGDGARCHSLRDSGRDIVSQKEKLNAPR